MGKQAKEGEGFRNLQKYDPQPRGMGELFSCDRQFVSEERVKKRTRHKRLMEVVRTKKGNDFPAGKSNDEQPRSDRLRLDGKKGGE